MYRQFNNRQANNVLFNPVMPQQHYPQYVYQQPQAQVRYQPQVQYIQYPQQVQYIKKPAQYLQYQCPVYQQTPYQQVQQGQLVQRPVRYPYIQHAPQAAYVNQYQAKLPMKYAKKPPKVRNPWNGNTYSFESYEPDSREGGLYRQGFVKYKDGNYYNINNHQALKPYTDTPCIFK